MIQKALKCPECSDKKNDTFKRRGEYKKAKAMIVGDLVLHQKCFETGNKTYSPGYWCKACAMAIPLEEYIPLSGFKALEGKYNV